MSPSTKAAAGREVLVVDRDRGALVVELFAKAEERIDLRRLRRTNGAEEVGLGSGGTVRVASPAGCRGLSADRVVVPMTASAELLNTVSPVVAWRPGGSIMLAERAPERHRREDLDVLGA